MPGELVDLTAPADRLDVPPARLRSALRDLEAEGLVLAGGNRHVTVAPLNTRELGDIFALRRALEPDMLARACASGPLGSFADFARLAAGRPVADWRDDQVFIALRRAYLDFIRPVVSGIELSVADDLTSCTERASRIGFEAVQLGSPSDIALVNAANEALIEACRDRSPVGVQVRSRQFLALIEDLCWHGVRAVRSNTG
ncbi:MAG TPA: hypothetical protein VGM60_13150 [Pseudonocardia sp.]|uniref:hypothetical protein n=1 Tax=Pseudonocardia sp. TaxID=60912 RepID=UPI002F42573B